jgi:hypothetical protein
MERLKMSCLLPVEGKIAEMENWTSFFHADTRGRTDAPVLSGITDENRHNPKSLSNQALSNFPRGLLYDGYYQEGTTVELYKEFSNLVANGLFATRAGATLQFPRHIATPDGYDVFGVYGASLKKPEEDPSLWVYVSLVWESMKKRDDRIIKTFINPKIFKDESNEFYNGSDMAYVLTEGVGPVLTRYGYQEMTAMSRVGDDLRVKVLQMIDAKLAGYLYSYGLQRESTEFKTSASGIEEAVVDKFSDKKGFSNLDYEEASGLLRFRRELLPYIRHTKAEYHETELRLHDGNAPYTINIPLLYLPFKMSGIVLDSLQPWLMTTPEEGRILEGGIPSELMLALTTSTYAENVMILPENFNDEKPRKLTSELLDPGKSSGLFHFMKVPKPGQNLRDLILDDDLISASLATTTRLDSSYHRDEPALLADNIGRWENKSGSRKPIWVCDAMITYGPNSSCHKDRLSGKQVLKDFTPREKRVVGNDRYAREKWQLLNPIEIRSRRGKKTPSNFTSVESLNRTIPSGMEFTL